MILRPLKEKNATRWGFILIVGLVLIMFGEYIGFLKGINNYFYDLSFRLRGAREPNRNIIIVTIDEKTLSKLGRWPIRRIYYAQLLSTLEEAGAVGFDIILSESSADDPILGAAIKRHGRVLVPAYIDSRFNVSYPSKACSGAIIGHIHLEQGIDGIVREVFHRVSYGGNSLPSFSSSIYNFITTGKAEYAGVQPGALDPDRPGSIFQGEPMLINFYGPPGTYPSISFLDVIEGKWQQSSFKDKIILVGPTAPGLEDFVLTPFTQDRNKMAGVEVHANILNNLLDQNPIRPFDQWLRWPVVLAVSLLGFLAFTGSGGIRATQIWLLSLFAAAIFVFFLFAVFNIWFAPASFFFSVTFVFLLAYVFRLEKMGILLLKAKEDWEESFNTINDAITIHDREGKIVRANNEAERNFGAPLLDILSKRCLDFKNRGNHSQAQDLTGHDTGINGDVIEEIFDPETEKYLEVKSIPRFDESRRFDGVVQIVRDITERVKTERERQNLQFQLTQAQKMEAIGTLAGGIAHDFNNILSAIIGYTELAYYEIPEGNKAQSRLKEVLKGGERARDLVNQILTFSRQTEHEKRPVQIGLVIKEALKLLRSSLPSNIEIKTDIDTGGMVIGDPTQIHQIAMNLCTNAYHAMREQGGILGIELKTADIDSDFQNPDLPPGPYIRLSVSDTGQGIPPGHLKRIFDPYFTTKKRGEGTGLGLAVVNGIVQAHRGIITVQSEQGKGTRFEICLPRIEEAFESEKTEPEPTPRGNERILIVDDEEALAVMGKEMLERLGYKVVAKASSIEALETFREGFKEFDLVITDMAMPHMTGEKLAGELMKIRPDIPVILCTGFSEMMNEEKAKVMGIRAFTMKPLVMGDLGRTIRKVLDKREGK